MTMNPGFQVDSFDVILVGAAAVGLRPKTAGKSSVLLVTLRQMRYRYTNNTRRELSLSVNWSN